MPTSFKTFKNTLVLRMKYIAYISHYHDRVDVESLGGLKDIFFNKHQTIDESLITVNPQDYINAKHLVIETRLENIYVLTTHLSLLKNRIYSLTDQTKETSSIRDNEFSLKFSPPKRVSQLDFFAYSTEETLTSPTSSFFLFLETLVLFLRAFQDLRSENPTLADVVEKQHHLVFLECHNTLLCHLAKLVGEGVYDF